MSTTAKTASINISTTIGTANKNIALFRLPVVKSCSVPAKASLRFNNSLLYFDVDLFINFEATNLVIVTNKERSELFPDIMILVDLMF